LRLKDGAADDILRCDKFDIVALAAEFELSPRQFLDRFRQA